MNEIIKFIEDFFLDLPPNEHVKAANELQEKIVELLDAVRQGEYF